MRLHSSAVIVAVLALFAFSGSALAQASCAQLTSECFRFAIRSKGDEFSRLMRGCEEARKQCKIQGPSVFDGIFPNSERLPPRQVRKPTESEVPSGRCFTREEAYANMKREKNSTLTRLSIGEFQNAFDAIVERNPNYRPANMSFENIGQEDACVTVSWIRSDGAAWVLRYNLNTDELRAKYGELQAKGFRMKERQMYKYAGETLWAAIWTK